MDYKRKNYPDPKRVPKRKRPQQLQTKNVPANNVGSTNNTNQGEDLLFTY